MVERADLERKRSVDLDDRLDSLRLVKEIAAMANSGGGRIIVGVLDDGNEVGIAPALAAKFDPARIGDLLDSFLSPDRIEVDVKRRVLPAGDEVLELLVPAAVRPPLVLCKSGNYEVAGKQQEVFGAHSVFVRRNTKAERARRADFLRWTEEAEERIRATLLERVAMVVEAPHDAHVRLVLDDAVVDEPSYLLSRSTDVFQVRPDRLLSGGDLIYLWKHRDVLTFTPRSRELIIQSALRKRATLYLWVGYLRPSTDELTSVLLRSFDMNDRDKSDAGRGILTLAALYLTDAGYDEIAARLRGSRYAHFREAAAEMPDRPIAVAHIEDLVGQSIYGTPVNQFSETELLDTADSLLDRGSGRSVSRQLVPVGLQFLRLRLT